MEAKEKKLKKIIETLQSDENLLDCFLEMIDTAEGEKNEIHTGDDAETAVVSIIQKTGRTLLQKWVSKKREESECHAFENPSIRPQEKKISLAHLFGERRNNSSNISHEK